MRSPLFGLIVLIAVLACMVGPANSSSREDKPSSVPTQAVLFVQNVGQFDPRARFQARAGDVTLWLADDALWLTLVTPAAGPEVRGGEGGSLDRGPVGNASLHRAVNLKLSFVGANPYPVLEPQGRLATHFAYFHGNDPTQWRTDAPVWSSVRYRDLYPGIDLEVRGTSQGWHLALDVRPGLDLHAVRLRVEGAENLAVDGAALRLETEAGEIQLPLLTVRGAASPAGPVVDGDIVLAPFGPADLVAQTSNPIPGAGEYDLIYSTFLGGFEQDDGLAIAIDSAGAAYVTGYTFSPDFPTTPGSYDPACNGGGPFIPCMDAFVAKLSPDGSRLVYSTYLGGASSVDSGNGIAVDPTGAAYVAGYTSSADFPTTPGAYNRIYVSGGSVFVTKLAPDGAALVYSTFVGSGCPHDLGHQCGLALDSTGDVYVVGATLSSGYPTTPGAFQTVCSNYCDYWEGFVTKLNADGSALVYSTFLGGSSTDFASRVVLDATGAAYVTGFTFSSDFPTTAGAFDTSFNGVSDAFVTKLAPDGTALEYSTFMGGSQRECYYDCVVGVDSSGAVYITGDTQSADLPTTPGAFSRTFYGGSYLNADAFATKITPDGSALVVCQASYFR